MYDKRRSCLYMRPLTSNYLGDFSRVTDVEFTDNNTYPDNDLDRCTSFMTSNERTYGVGWVCGFGRIFMNGQFNAEGSLDFIHDSGWLGDYKNNTFNRMIGALRQFNIMFNLVQRRDLGSSWLVITDGRSTTNETDLGHWGQLVKYMRVSDPNLMTTTFDDLQNGHLGFDGTHKSLMRFKGIMLLLNHVGPANIPQRVADGVAHAIRRGQGYICLQEGPSKGNYNFMRLFWPNLGITLGGAGHIVTTKKAVDGDKAKYGWHVGWSTVDDLHYSHTQTLSETYWIQEAPTWWEIRDTFRGQHGIWYPAKEIYDDYLTDDYVWDSEIQIRDRCCYRIGDHYEVDMHVTVVPHEPDDWKESLESGTHVIEWEKRIKHLPNVLDEIKQCPVWISSIGFEASTTGGLGQSETHIGDVVYEGEGRSFTVYQIDMTTHEVLDRRHFDVHGGGEGSVPGIAQATLMAEYLNSITGNVWILINTWDECSFNRMSGGLPEAMYRIGASEEIFAQPNFEYRSVYCLWGYPNAQKSNAIYENYKGESFSDVNSWMYTGFDFDNYGNPYCVAIHAHDHEPYTMGIVSSKDNDTYKIIRYAKTISTLDDSKVVGRKYDITMRDTRFNKLPMHHTVSPVYGVENPCIDRMNYPRPAVNDVSIVEGHSGAKWVNFTITLDEPVTGKPLNMRVKTRDGTARALADDTSVVHLGYDPNGIPAFSYLDYEKTRVVFDAGFPKYYNTHFMMDNDNNIQKFTRNCMDWLRRDRRKNRILITGDKNTDPYSVVGTDGASFGVSLPNYLRGLGYQVDSAIWSDVEGGAPSALHFDNYDVVIFFSSAFTPMNSPSVGISFVKSLESAVRRGCGLMIITDHSDAVNGFASSANALASRFYSRFAGSYNRTHINVDDIRRQIGDHPLIHEIYGNMAAFNSEGRVDSDGTVGDPQDYVPRDDVITFNIGEQTKTFPVQVLGDTLVEGDEYFYLELSELSRENPVPPVYIKQQGKCTIEDDDGTEFGSSNSSGNYGVEWKQQLYKNNTGVFIVHSTHYSAPDRVDVFRDAIWLDGAPKPAHQVPYDFPDGKVISSLGAAGGDHEVCIAHYAELAYTTYYEVRMQGTATSTGWNYNTIEDSVKPMSGEFIMGPYPYKVRIHDTRTSGRSSPFTIRVRFNGTGKISLRRVGQPVVTGVGSGVYDMVHSPATDFPYIEVHTEGTGKYTIEVV